MDLLFVARDLDGESERVVIAGMLPGGILVPVIVFDNFSKFEKFVGEMQDYINAVRPPIPDAFIRAFIDE